MSRIHEALKRAEQERAASQTAQKSEEHAERVVASSAVETVPPPASVLPPAVSPSPAAPHIEPEVASGSLRFEELLAKCPQADWKPDPNSLVFGNPNPFFPGAEQFPLQTILISSAIPAEGKTLVATNLAYALVRQRGCRALLVDADLRSPRIHMLLGAPSNPGLADYLQNTATEFETIQHGREDGLCFIPAGNHVTHPSELISSDRMKKFLDRVRPAFDWIIIDSPPALPVADASVLGGLVDGVLFVVRANSTPSEASLKACKELRDSHILGVVLNTADGSTEYSSYYSSGSYGNSLKGQRK